MIPRSCVRVIPRAIARGIDRGGVLLVVLSMLGVRLRAGDPLPLGALLSGDELAESVLLCCLVGVGLGVRLQGRWSPW